MTLLYCNRGMMLSQSTRSFLSLVTSPVFAHTRYSFIIVYMRAVSVSKISLRRMEFRKKIQI